MHSHTHYLNQFLPYSKYLLLRFSVYDDSSVIEMWISSVCRISFFLHHPPARSGCWPQVFRRPPAAIEVRETHPKVSCTSTRSGGGCCTQKSSWTCVTPSRQLWRGLSQLSHKSPLYVESGAEWAILGSEASDCLILNCSYDSWDFSPRLTHTHSPAESSRIYQRRRTDPRLWFYSEYNN